jgi:hypothetical protein
MEPDFRKEIMERRADRRHRIEMGILSVVVIMSAAMLCEFAWRAARFIVEAAR